MADITQNLFFWFRGPSGGGDEGSQRQLENNLTKSLVNVLKCCDRRLVLGALLKKLRLPPCEDIVFSLQRKPLLAGTTPKRIVLGITGGDPAPIRGRGTKDIGRPDAWICGSSWTILVESKIGPKITKAQIERHARAAGWHPGSYRTEFLRWSAIHKMCKEAHRHTPKRDEVTHLLLTEWLSYLEFQNMTKFEKLERTDFDFFNCADDERRALLPHMKRRLHDFAAMIAKTAPARAIARLYGKSDSESWRFGEIDRRGRGAWFNVGGSPAEQRWHVTVYFRPNGLGVSLVNSQRGLVSKLCNSDDNIFRQILDLARGGRDIHVTCRRAWYKDPGSPYKGQNISHTDDPFIVRPAALNKAERGNCAEILSTMLQRFRKDRRWRAELQIQEELPWAKVLRLSREKQVAAVAKALARLRPILTCLMNT